MSVKYYAHRGIFDNKTVYENTLTAFSQAIKHGVGIELDVRITKDNVLIVYHDANLKRLFQSNLKIKDLTYVALNKFKFDDELIPTLKDVLDFVAGQVPLIIEIKDGHDRNIICYETSKLLDSYNGKFLVESFDPLIVRWFKKHRPLFKRGQLIMPAKKYKKWYQGMLVRTHITHFLTNPDFYAYEVTLGKNFLSRFILKLYAKEICVWTVKPNQTVNFDAEYIIFEDPSMIDLT